MKLHIIGSGSSGNCYYLKPENGKGLLIECGLPFKKIKEGINYDLFNVAGCLTTHEHKDHAKCPQELINSGIPVYMSFGTGAALKLNNPTCIIAGDLYEIGEFRVKAFEVEHDAKQPLGFLIYHPEMGSMVFATDTKTIKYQFEDVNHWLIEANFSETIMLDGLTKEGINAHLANRVYDNHMSIETCIEVLENNDLSNCRSITLIHLSSTNAWGELFQDLVSRSIGIKPKIAKKGLTISL
jgi:phosphoribosyl 1,2-cyclic phosphodiesterase